MNPNLRCVAVIPARFGSTRFPGKPLALLAGKPMIQHVWERVQKARGLLRTVVATDDERIARAVTGFGGEVAMTGECPTGTDRVCKAVRDLDVDVVLNVQGDQPLIEPAPLESLLAAFEDQAVRMATLKRPLETGDAENPNMVKVACARNGDALYFSRSLIPFPRNDGTPAWAHIGVYAYRKDFLIEVTAMPQTPLEHAECLEQLRVLEHGHRIRVVETTHRGFGVDTPEDLKKARARIDTMFA
jgi:3-deoxy-manno-octulosonate cytidylyltransferase (CMP-KDO synthetase)